MDELELSRLLDEPAFAFGRPVGRPHVGAVLLGCDVASSCGVVATVRSRTDRYVALYVWRRTGDAWADLFEAGDRWPRYVALYVWRRTGDAWADLFEAGDRWPLTLPAEGSDDRGFRLVGGVSASVTESATGFAVCAGIASASVERVEVSSPLDRHAVALDPDGGAFVAICPLAEGMTMRLTAFEAGGSEVDTVSFTLQPVDWDDDDDL